MFYKFMAMALATGFFMVPAQPAQAAWFSGYFETAKPSVQLVEEDVGIPQGVDPKAYENDCSNLKGDKPNPLGLAVNPVQIINIGMKLWQIVADNKPVVSVSTQWADALPEGIRCWNELSHWELPRTRLYDVTYTNGWNMDVVRLKLRFIYAYGGQYNNKGSYLANVTVLPDTLDVMWGYNFSAKVEVPYAINIGTVDDPTAGLEVDVKWTVKTVVKESHESLALFVDGNGNVKEL